MKHSKRISTPLLKWFHQHGRKDLPWQKNPTAYRVWISEIMLQQTQVATVIPYYQQFMKSFPNLNTLANSSLDEVLHHWSGLGYYARAHNLHKTAVIIRDQYHGRFPRDIEQVLTLPGIGRSTAGAILSLACGQRHAILDGNVKRVLSRYCLINGWPGQQSVAEQLWHQAEHFSPGEESIAYYNQAIMDLGATVCTRSRPLCEVCPLKKNCAAYATQQQHLYPQKKPKKTLPQKQVHLLLLQNAQDEILLVRRPPTGIWGGLWSLPECPLETEVEDHCRRQFGVDCSLIRPLPLLQHRFSHYELIMHPLHLRFSSIAHGVMETEALFWYKGAGQAVGLPSPIKKLLSAFFTHSEGELL